MSSTFLRAIGFLSAASLAWGCTVTTETAEAPEFKGGGQVGFNTFEYGESYPAAPYGYDVGAVIPPYQFIGYVNFVQPILEGMQVLDLTELYNPTGSGTFGEGSQYGAGTPKPKALMMTMGASWCGPCKLEAATVLPDKYALYRPMGGEFLMFLAQDVYGDPAGPSALNSWDQQYGVNYPSSIDPSGDVMIHFENAFPGNLILDLRTMRIVARISGSPLEPGQGDCAQPNLPAAYAANCTFWTTFEEVLAGTHVP